MFDWDVPLSAQEAAQIMDLMEYLIDKLMVFVKANPGTSPYTVHTALDMTAVAVLLLNLAGDGQQDGEHALTMLDIYLN